MDARSTSDDAASAIADVPRVRALLIAAAQERRAVGYAELLQALGTRFTRPRMRALCRTLDAIDRDRGDDPALAVLVVRESDRLPGQGWWIARPEHEGPWTGPQAAALVRSLQEEAFARWG